MRTTCLFTSLLVLTAACERNEDAVAAKKLAMADTARVAAPSDEPPERSIVVRPSSPQPDVHDAPGLLPKPPPELSTAEEARPDVPPSLSGTAAGATKKPFDESAKRHAADDAAAAASPRDDQPERRPVSGDAEDDETLSVRGEVTQGGLVVVDAPNGTKSAKIGGRSLRIGEDGTILVAFAHDAPERHTLLFVNGDGESVRHVFEVAQRDYDETTIEGLPKKEITPQNPDQRSALARAHRQIAAARSHDTAEAYYREGFSWPASGPITSTYGVMRDFGGELESRHWGVDIAVPVGTAVKAPAGGIVRLAEPSVPLSGGLVILDHGHGLSSSFLHLSKIEVKEGAEVKKGQVIARSGDSGRTTGPHLDWRMNLFEVRIDPKLVVGLRLK